MCFIKLFKKFFNLETFEKDEKPFRKPLYNIGETCKWEYLNFSDDEYNIAVVTIMDFYYVSPNEIRYEVSYDGVNGETKKVLDVPEEELSPCD